jgi:hypothetical protein
MLLEMFLERSFLLKSGSSHYCTFGTVLATNLIQNEVDGRHHGRGMMAAASLPPLCLLQVV